jgi:hypothetical protein
MPKPLYFLTHNGRPHIFSGYGIPLNEGKSPLVGMLMVDRPARCPDNYLKDLKQAFGHVVIGPMTIYGERGIYTQMRIEDPFSLELVKDDFPAGQMEETRYVLDLALKGGFLPKPKLKLHWSKEERLWISEFDLGGSCP